MTVGIEREMEGVKTVDVCLFVVSVVVSVVVVAVAVAVVVVVCDVKEEGEGEGSEVSGESVIKEEE